MKDRKLGALQPSPTFSLLSICYNHLDFPDKVLHCTISNGTKNITQLSKHNSCLVSWCFNPSQPQRIISGLRETFVKRYIVEISNKADIRSEEESKKRRVVGRIYGMKYSCNGHKGRNRHKNRIKRSEQAQLVYVKDINHIPTM